jgi:GT2 family glycosyltransferase
MPVPLDSRCESNIPAPATKPCSIASVTVAYNGAGVLREHLQSLKRQSRRLDEIIVVDNASTDNTVGILAREFPDVTVLRLPENSGIGGGLAAGLVYAVEKAKHDWVWTFDQDSLPASNALECLLAGFELSGGLEKNIAIVAPVCANPAAGVTYPPLSWRGSRFLPVSYLPDQRFAFADMVISSGSLMRSAAIAQAGLPRSDFFIDFVDYEYCLRLRQQGFRIAVVRDSILDHAIGSPTTFHLLGRTKSWADHAPWREYYMTRNEIFTIWMYRPRLFAKCFVLYRLAHHALGILLFGKHKLECLQMIGRGLVDGRAGRLGHRYIPGDARSQDTVHAAPYAENTL